MFTAAGCCSHLGAAAPWKPADVAPGALVALVCQMVPKVQRSGAAAQSPCGSPLLHVHRGRSCTRLGCVCLLPSAAFQMPLEVFERFKTLTCLLRVLLERLENCNTASWQVLYLEALL